MKKTGLARFKNADVNAFTSNFGLSLRRKVSPVWRRILRLCTSRKVHVEQYPKLEKHKNYIFVGNHSFDEDVISLLSSIDRNAYLLQGTTNQMEHNPIFYAVWLNGMIYVNRMDKQSRTDAIDKMRRVLQAGNSVLLFPEGGYNNTENQLVMPLFSSPYLLCKEMNIEVVPIISICKEETKEIFIRAGEPMNISTYSKEDALAHLRDVMSTIIFEIVEKHFPPVRRAELRADAYRDFLEQRKVVYECQKWYEDVWDEELTYYPGHGVTTPQKAREYIDQVNVTHRNARILADTLVRREEDKQHDLKDYLRRNLQLRK